MTLFTSNKEKKLWFFVLLIVSIVFSSIWFSLPILEFVRAFKLDFYLFLLMMLLIGITILFHGLMGNNQFEIVIILGLFSVFMLLFLRLSLPERSHLIEYSILSIFIHNALKERFRTKKSILIPAAFAFLFTVIIGAIDEFIQLFVPYRYFDWIDVLFNSIVAFMAIFTALVLSWIKKRININ